MNYTAVIKFWFEDIDKSYWFKKDADFDQLVTDKFLALHQAALNNELYEWRNSIQGRLAEIILLDQFSRNMFRDSPRAFAGDALSLCLAQEAIAQKLDRALSITQRSFLYMPFMHSESLVIHQKALQLFSAEGLQNNLKFEIKHKLIIEKYGRYPHRNKVLGRTSSDEERHFLQQPDSSF